MKVGIINYSLGNVGSVYSAFSFYKADVTIITEPSEMRKSDLIVLAGVGNYMTAVRRLKELGFWDELNQRVLEKKKLFFGICLGMQLFADLSHEGGLHNGFGWIKGEVKLIDSRSARVPHMGWNKVEPKDDRLFRGGRYGYYYFMHSYHFVPEDPKVIAGITDYGGLKIVSAVRKDNLIGVQFHPEKSQGDGLRMIRNVLEEVR